MDRHQRSDVMLSSAMGIALAIVVAARLVATNELAARLTGRLYFAVWFMEVGLWALASVLIFGGLLRISFSGGSRGMMIAAGGLSILLAPIGGGLV